MYRYSRLCLLVLLALLVIVPSSAAHPLRGSVKWSVLLCAYSDAPVIMPRTSDFYRDMFLNPNTGGMADYWRAISNRGIDFSGSVVRGWYRQGISFGQSQSRTRNQIFQDCIDTARNAPVDSYTPPADHLIAVITFPDRDMFGMPGGGAFLPASIDLGGMAHEVGHGMGLNHSFSDDPNYRNATWSQIGEYDDQWDLMSWANTLRTPTTRFGDSGPSLNAYHLDRMGWLPLRRVYTFGANGQRQATLTLAALSQPNTAGHLLVRIPFDPGDMFHYYTVEFRRNTGWDGGIGLSRVLIHEVKKGADGQYYTYLLRSHSGSRDPLQTLNANGVTITVITPAPQSNQATIMVTGNIADRCLQGFVWREARPSDHVCVTGATRAQTRLDNAAAAQRRNPNGGLYGPDTCRVGFVWREAYPGDHVCVTGATRTQARTDNAAAAQRRNPARFVYGPNTCAAGYVWREADGSDYVCVTGATRTQTRTDNILAAQRRSPNGGPYGPDTCRVGYVWREAYPGDHVCVTGATRSQARADNAAARSRLLKQ